LQPALHELIEGQTKDVIEFSLIILEETKLHNSSNEGVTFKSLLGSLSSRVRSSRAEL
jgi:hypothetical protein